MELITDHPFSFSPHIHEYNIFIVTICSFSDVSRQQNHSFNPMPSWDCESMTNDQSNDRHGYSDEDDPDTLVSQPRQVCLLTCVFVDEIVATSIFFWRWHILHQTNEMVNIIC